MNAPSTPAAGSDVHTGADAVRLTTAPDARPTAAWWSLLVCLGLSLVVYGPAALGASYLGFDDTFFFGPDNPEFRRGIAAVFDPSHPIANAFLPVAHLSLWLDWAWCGSAPFWPHLHAALLHGLAAFVLARFLLALRAPSFVAHLAAALFVVHPALAESVAWVSGRKDLLSGLFVVLALHQTVAFARRPGVGRALLLAALAALAMYSKATAVVLPLLAALVCAFVDGPRVRWSAVLVLLAAVVPISLHHQAIAAAEGTLADGSAAERLQQVPGAFAHYLTTSLWPLRLNVLYPEVDTLAAFRAGFAGGTAWLLAFVAAAAIAWGRGRWRLAGLGLAAFVIGLLPFNTAFPASSIAAADRYLYLALPGLTLAIAFALARPLARAPWAAALLVLPLAWLAGGRARAFADDETLWRTSLATEPTNAVAHLNLVQALTQRGPAKFDEVKAHLEAAAQAARYPIHEVRARQLLTRIALADADYPRAATEAKAAIAAATAQLARETGDKRRAEAKTWLFTCQLAAFEPLRLAGDEAGANACHDEAKRIAPDHPDVIAFGALRDLAGLRDELVALAKAGKPPVLAEDDARAVAADAMLAAALERHPQHAGLLCARGEWERARGRVLPAMRWYGAAETADPNCLQAWLSEARLLREREQWALAEKKARAGLAVRQDPALRQELALALVGQGKLDDAELHLEAYMRAHPDDHDTAKVLSNVLVGRAYARLSAGGTDRTQQEVDDVVRIIERALAYNPKEVRAHLVLGRLAKDAGQLVTAAKHLEKAYTQMPGFDEARQLYAETLAALGWKRRLGKDEDGAVAAWRRCVDVAPADFDHREIDNQLQRAWERSEQLGVDRKNAGDRAGAVAAFRKCLTILPDQHWASWQLAIALQEDPQADLAELEALCRQAVAWQQRHALDGSAQALLLARTLLRAGRADEGRAAAKAALQAPHADAKPQVIEALRALAGD